MALDLSWLLDLFNLMQEEESTISLPDLGAPQICLLLHMKKLRFTEVNKLTKVAEPSEPDFKPHLLNCLTITVCNSLSWVMKNL